MKIRSTTDRRLGILVVFFTVLAILVITAVVDSQSDSRSTAAANQAHAENSLVKFNDDGELIRPTDYRKWTYVGTPLTPNSK